MLSCCNDVYINHFLNIDFSIVPPIFLSKPCLVVGTPVFLATFCLIAVIPIALLSENDTPGIFIAICYIFFLNILRN